MFRELINVECGRRSPTKCEDGVLILMSTLNLLDSPACIHRGLWRFYRIISLQLMKLQSG